MTSATAVLETNPEVETSEEPVQGPNYDDINTPVVVMVGVISIVITICTIFFVQGLTYHWQNGYIRERSYDFVNEPVRVIVEDQKKVLEGNSEKGIKPVEETIQDVIAEFGKN